MLRELNIKNYVLIDQLNIEFGQGLNVLTGETGAGKSIIVDAVNLVLGGRSMPEHVRTGCEEAILEALFDLSSSKVELNLGSKGIDTGEGIIVVKRGISRSGRSRCYVNGQMVTLSQLQELGRNLVDIHGQHEHQSLLRTEEHIDLLDSFGGLNKLCAQLTSSFHKFKDLERRLSDLIREEKERERLADLWKFQLTEIAGANLKEGEEEELRRERVILSNAEKLYELVSQTYGELYEGESGQGSILERLGQTLGKLKEVAKIDITLKELVGTMEAASFQLTDVSHSLRDYRDKIEFNPDRLEEIEARLDIVSRLKKKYGETIAEILTYKEKIKKDLEKITRSQEEISQREKEISDFKVVLNELALNLSRKRKEIAQRMEEEVKRELESLGMEKTIFKVELSNKEEESGLVKIEGISYELRPKGIDRVEFLLSPNPGEELRPLSKIASGGEISRIMLALKSILAAGDRIPIMIFDEIDVGIGGRIAEVVGRRLKLVGSTRQIICITHLPQIASLADQHFSVEKEVVGGRTRTKIKKLSPSERIKEIARMLGGEKVTEITLKHAQEMLAGEGKN